MKKFKHKITGELATETNNVWYHSLQFGVIHKDLIESSNDWEKVLEKEYEILSIIEKAESRKIYLVKHYDKTGAHLSRYHTKHENFDPTEFHGAPDTSTYITQNYNIHSIKRLSDGEVFTIGDRIEADKKGIIIKFVIDNLFKSGLGVYCDKDIVLGGYNNCCISYINKCNSPIFITEDGVEVFENDNVWILSNWNPVKITAYSNKWGTTKSVYNLAFSTEKAAKNYIKCHKPVLSYNDVLTMFDALAPNIFVSRIDYKNELTKLVESKL